MLAAPTTQLHNFSHIAASNQPAIGNREEIKRDLNRLFWEGLHTKSCLVSSQGSRMSFIPGHFFLVLQEKTSQRHVLLVVCCNYWSSIINDAFPYRRGLSVKRVIKLWVTFYEPEVMGTALAVQGSFVWCCRVEKRHLNKTLQYFSCQDIEMKYCPNKNKTQNKFVLVHQWKWCWPPRQTNEISDINFPKRMLIMLYCLWEQCPGRIHFENIILKLKKNGCNTGTVSPPSPKTNQSMFTCLSKLIWIISEIALTGLPFNISQNIILTMLLIKPTLG